MFAGRVKIVSHSFYRTSAILKYFCSLLKEMGPGWTSLAWYFHTPVFCISRLQEEQQRRAAKRAYDPRDNRDPYWESKRPNLGDRRYDSNTDRYALGS